MLLLMLGGVGLPAEDRPEEKAQHADEAWLALVDGSKYAESWTAAAPAFQAAISQDGWAKAANGVRGPLGKVETRKLTDATYTKTLPGAPDGEYVVVHYATTFEHKKDAVETVASSLQKDGSWKLIGYYIK